MLEDKPAFGIAMAVLAAALVVFQRAFATPADSDEFREFPWTDTSGPPRLYNGEARGANSGSPPRAVSGSSRGVGPEDEEPSTTNLSLTNSSTERQVVWVLRGVRKNQADKNLNGGFIRIGLDGPLQGNTARIIVSASPAAVKIGPLRAAAWLERELPRLPVGRACRARVFPGGLEPLTTGELRGDWSRPDRWRALKRMRAGCGWIDPEYMTQSLEVCVPTGDADDDDAWFVVVEPGATLRLAEDEEDADA